MFKRIFILQILLVLVLGVVTGFGVNYFLQNRLLKTNIINLNLFNVSRPRIIGFLPFWLVEKLDKNYETYITDFTYFGITIEPDGHIKKLNSPQEQEPGWTMLNSDKFTSLINAFTQKGISSSLLIFNANEDEIIKLIDNPETHAQNLVSDITPLIKKYGFRDLNLDIESFLEASPHAQIKYSQFVKKVKEDIAKIGNITLTVEIAPISLIKPRLTNAKMIADYADYIVLMAYDYHYINSFLAGPVAPISGAGEVRELDVETSIIEALKIIPQDKLILGISLYGYEWETVSDILGSAVIPGSGKTASTRRIEELLKTCLNCTETMDETAKQPAVVYEDASGKYINQVFYENSESLAEKITLAHKYSLAGTALWALGYDDSRILNPLVSYKNSVLLDFSSETVKNN